MTFENVSNPHTADGALLGPTERAMGLQTLKPGGP